MPSKSKLLSEAEIVAFEATRDIGEEILQSIRDLKAGKGKVVLSPAIEARSKTGLSQSQFASLLGVSVRTLQGWEQGRKQPSGAARTLLAIARSNPKAVLAVSKQHVARAVNAVGTPITGRPPHRSGRAQLRHPAPTLG